MTTIPEHELKKTYRTIWLYWAIALAFFLACMAVCYYLQFCIVKMKMIFIPNGKMSF